MFEGRKLLIATKHQKEKVIAPFFEKELGVECFTDNNFDTDTLGTFTGEIERTEDPVSTLRKKCLLAMEAAQCDLAVASEGSFGPHPLIFFAPADEEWMIFIDKKNHLEIIEKILSTETNFNAKQVYSLQELLDFANDAQFPEHGLILRKDKADFSKIIKGITNQNQLIEQFNQLMDEHGSAYVETDMRAMYNPNRMKVIGALTSRLIKKIQTVCPQCNTPGFGVTKVVSGLPCNVCGAPTRSVLLHEYRCAKCNFVKEIKFPNNQYTEDPMYCDVCNP